jgi:Spy/CpxP family protein refolding chaperone
VLTGKWIAVAAAALMTGSVLFAADETATPPAETPPPAHHQKKLSKPYSELSGLTDDQKAKIITAHADYLEQEKALLAKEKETVEAVLTDDQKAQLTTLEEAAAAGRKEKTAKRKEMKDTGGEPTTQPAQ